MFRDDDLVLSDGQGLAGAAAIKSSKEYDGKVTNKLGAGNPLFLIVEITKAFTSNAAIAVQLRSNGSSGGGAGSGGLIASGEISAANSRIAGHRLEILIPSDADVARYIFAAFDGAAALAGGSVSAWITNQRESYQYIKSGYAV